MRKSVIIHLKIVKRVKYAILPILVLGTVLPSFMASSNLNLILPDKSTNIQNLAVDLNVESDNRLKYPLNSKLLAENDTDILFPDFLVFSIEIANALIDYLYDDVSGGFFTSTDEHWSENTINTEKQTYDNAQAILALVKLSEALINQTQKDYALEMAEKTGSFLISELQDEIFDGFFTSYSFRYKKPGIQAKAIQALLSLYEVTNNDTYRSAAIDTFNFLENEDAWDDTGSYAYLLSHSGLVLGANPDQYEIYEPQSKRVDHNALMGMALLDLYREESNATIRTNYLTKATKIYDFFNNTCRNNVTTLFYSCLTGSNEILTPDSSDIFINSLVLEFLSQLYNVTGDSKYYDDFFLLINAVMVYFWDNLSGGFFATYSYLDSGDRDTKKYTERLFYVLRAFDEAYKLTNGSFYYNLILDVFEFLNNKLYDHVHYGYYQLTNADGTPGTEPSWNYKVTRTQSLSVYALANLWLYSKPGVLNALWSPINPRPQDPVTISTAAFDSDGLSNVMLNYSINNNSYQVVEMIPHPIIGNMFSIELNSNGNFSHSTRLNFKIIVNDTLGNLVIRGSYFLAWQDDIWAPQIQDIGINPGTDILVNSEFTITVKAQDVPSQGDVEVVDLAYHLTGESEQYLRLEKTDQHIWTVTFPEGVPEVGTYAYYFIAMDDEGNAGHNAINNFYVRNPVGSVLPQSLIVVFLFIIFILTPTGLYSYVEYKKKSARKILKDKQQIRYQKRRGRRRKKGRQTQSRIENPTETQK